MSNEPLRFQHFEVYQDPNGRPLELGRGGMGVTYKAFDVNLGRDVALKVISPQLVSGEEARQRFLREARTAASFRHPHVASVHHLGEADGSCFYAMEFVEGETLESFCKRDGKIPAATALEILDQVADALGAAGKQQLVHRDIKPANIMLQTDSSGQLSAMLIDFGLAKSFQRTEGDTSATLTVSGFVGTPAYASPEQLETLPLDGRTDIYSLGVTFFYMLCGKPPFSGSLASVISQHLTRPLPITELAGQSREVVQLVVEMTSKSRDDRPSNGGELRRRIAQCRAAMEKGQEEPNSEGDHWLSPYLSGKQNSDNTNRRGRSFDACIPDGGNAEILVLHREWTSDPAAVTDFGSAIQKLNIISHAEFRKVLSVESVKGQTVAVCEKIDGIPLLNILKTRKTLHPSEAFAILLPVARALDRARDLALCCPDITLHDIFLTPSAPASTNIADWPHLAVRVDALAFLHQQAFGGDGTMIPGLGQPPPGATSLQAKYLGISASLVCEVLGSHRDASTAFTPLPALTADSNSVLRRALAFDPSFLSLEDFIRALESAEKGNQPRSKPLSSLPAQSLIFISHSSKDKLIGEAITARLEARGIRCWIAPRDIVPGKDYSSQIVEALRKSNAIVVIFSKWANASRHLHSEVDRAFNLEKTIIPFRIDGTALDESLEYYLSNTHWLDALIPPLEEHIDRLADTILGNSLIDRNNKSGAIHQVRLIAAISAGILLLLFVAGGIFTLAKRNFSKTLAVPPTLSGNGLNSIDSTPPKPDATATGAVPTHTNEALPDTSNPFLAAAARDDEKMRASITPEQLAKVMKIWTRMMIQASKQPEKNIAAIGFKQVFFMPHDQLLLSPDSVNLNTLQCVTTNVQENEIVKLADAPRGAWIYIVGKPIVDTSYKRYMGSVMATDVKVLLPADMERAIQEASIVYNMEKESTRLPQEPVNTSKKATKESPFENSLGMRFVPLPGRDALMSVWDTRVQDFRAFALATRYRQQGGMGVLKVVKSKDGKSYDTTFELDTGASWEKPGFPQTAAHPVVGVNWEEAQAFCGWLTEKERAEGKIGREQEYRLPTDKEWSEAVGGERYPWGNQWPPPASAGNYGDDALVSRLPGNAWAQVPGNDGYAFTSPVGIYMPNSLGLCDLGGNVCQWCDDWYRANMNERGVLEKFPELKNDGGGKTYRVVRGGSWRCRAPEDLLSSVRFNGYPNRRSTSLGFRCVLGSSR